MTEKNIKKFKWYIWVDLKSENKKSNETFFGLKLIFFIGESKWKVGIYLYK